MSKQQNVIATKHALDFLVAKSPYGNDHQLYRVGTCDGQFYTLKDSLCILSVMNSNPGNGHFDDVLEWFEDSCKKHGVNLIVLELWNERFSKHLTGKRGFIALDIEGINVVKVFNQNLYKKLLKNGNEIIPAENINATI